MRVFALIAAAALAASWTAPASASDDPLSPLASRAAASPRDEAAQLAHVEALVRAARYGEAEQAVKKAKRALPRSLPVHLAEARVIFAREDFKNAKRACLALERLDPASIYTRLCLAEGFIALQRSARAFEEIEKIIAADPQSFEGHLAKADALRLRMMEAEAKAEYRVAAELRGTDPRPYVGLGLLAEAAGKRDEALSAFQRAFSLGADWPEVRFAFGRLSSGEAALGHLRAANELRRDWVPALEALGHAELAAGHVEAALTLFSRAVSLDDYAAGAHLGRGLSLTALGRDAEARAPLARTMALVPTSGRAALELARIEARGGEVEAALDLYRRAADQDRTDLTALLEAAELCLQHERATVAAAYLDRVLELSPQHAAALVLYGDTLMKRRKPEEARRYYERALRGTGRVDQEAIRARIAALP